MARLSTHVTLKDDADLPPAVQLDIFYDEDRSITLSKGYIFSEMDGRGDSERTGTEILGHIGEALSGGSKSNILSLIATYGVGKSHLALTLCNFFGRPAKHAASSAVLDNIETLGAGLADTLRSFKADEPRPSFVLPITLSDTSDLRKEMRLGIRKACKAAGVEFSIEDSFRAAEKWLTSRAAENEVAVELALERIGFKGGTDMLCQALELLENDALELTRDLSREFNAGTPLDFGHDIGLNRLLDNVLQSLCGDSGPYSSILIVLDELSAYLELWLHDRIRAGGMALQELTDLCHQNPTKVCLVTLAQFPLSKYEAQDGGEKRASVGKLTGRLQPERRLVSSLEHVIERVIVQSDSVRHSLNTLPVNIASNTAWGLQPQYKNRGVNQSEFFKLVTAGSYPMHPLTTSLLCYLASNAGFVQGRALLHFLKGPLRAHLLTTIDLQNPERSFLPAVSIFDYFGEYFREFSGLGDLYDDFVNAERQLSPRESGEFGTVLKAIFLNEACRIPIPDSHESNISQLAGISIDQVHVACLAMSERMLIRLDSTVNPPRFRFWQRSGGKLVELVKSRANELLESSKSVPPGQLARTDDRREKILSLVPQLAADLRPSLFLHEASAIADCWTAELRFLSATEVSERELCKAARGLNFENCRSVLMVILASSEEELIQAKIDTQAALDSFKYPEIGQHCVVAFPSRFSAALTKLATQLFVVNTLGAETRNKVGSEAVEALQVQLENDFLKTVASLLENLTYFCNGEAKQMLPSEGNLSAQEVWRAVLERTYPKVPPVNGVDKLIKPSKYVYDYALAFLSDRAREVFQNGNSAVKTVGTDVLEDDEYGMGLVEARFALRRVPANLHVKDAWMHLNQLLPPGGSVKFEKIWQDLIAPPFGYDHSTFLLIISAWLGVRIGEIRLGEPGKSVLEGQRLREAFASKSNVRKVLKWLLGCKLTRTNREKAKQLFGLYNHRLKVAGNLEALATSLSDLKATLAANREAATNEELEEMEALLNSAARLVDAGSKLTQKIEKVGSLEFSLGSFAVVMGELDWHIKTRYKFQDCEWDGVRAELDTKIAASQRALETRILAELQGYTCEAELASYELGAITGLIGELSNIESTIPAINSGLEKALASLKQESAHREQRERNREYLARMTRDAKVDSSWSLKRLREKLAELTAVSAEMTSPSKEQGEAAAALLRGLENAIETLEEWADGLPLAVSEVRAKLGDARLLYEEALSIRMRYEGTDRHKVVEDCIGDLRTIEEGLSKEDEDKLETARARIWLDAVVKQAGDRIRSMEKSKLIGSNAADLARIQHVIKEVASKELDIPASLQKATNDALALLHGRIDEYEAQLEDGSFTIPALHVLVQSVGDAVGSLAEFSDLQDLGFRLENFRANIQTRLATLQKEEAFLGDIAALVRRCGRTVTAIKACQQQLLKQKEAAPTPGASKHIAATLDEVGRRLILADEEERSRLEAWLTEQNKEVDLVQPSEAGEKLDALRAEWRRFGKEVVFSEEDEENFQNLESKLSDLAAQDRISEIKRQFMLLHFEERKACLALLEKSVRTNV
jgi:hypothetical protein